MTAAAVLLALAVPLGAQGAPPAPTRLAPSDATLRLELTRVAGVRELTQWYNHRLEEQIRQRPQQYWWLHNRWKDTTVRRRRKKKAAAPAPPLADQAQRPAA